LAQYPGEIGNIPGLVARGVCIRDILGNNGLPLTRVGGHRAGSLKNRKVGKHRDSPSINFNQGLTAIPLETVFRT
jgi:hypothetical protein